MWSGALGQLALGEEQITPASAHVLQMIPGNYFTTGTSMLFVFGIKLVAAAVTQFVRNIEPVLDRVRQSSPALDQIRQSGPTLEHLDE